MEVKELVEYLRVSLKKDYAGAMILLPRFLHFMMKNMFIQLKILFKLSCISNLLPIITQLEIKTTEFL
jgi:hypothetical protein